MDIPIDNYSSIRAPLALENATAHPPSSSLDTNALSGA
jgi:hypothetical protein